MTAGGLSHIQHIHIRQFEATIWAERRAKVSHAKFARPRASSAPSTSKGGPLILHPHHQTHPSPQANVTLPTSPPFRDPHKNSSQGGRSPAWSRPGYALLRSLGYWHWYCAARVHQVHLETSWGLTVGSDGYLSRQPSSYGCIPHLLSAPPPSLTTFFISPHLRTTLAPPSTNRGFG